MKPGVNFKISFSIVFIIACSMVINLLLNYFSYDNKLREVTRSRLEGIGNDIRQSIEYSLNLGLDLREAKGIHTTITSIVGRNRSVALIDIFDNTGTVLFSSDPSRFEKILQDSWRVSESQQARSAFTLPHPELFVVGLPIYNSFDVAVGTIALGYLKSDIEAKKQEMLIALIRDLIISLFIYGVITVIGVIFIMRFFKGVFEELYEASTAYLSSTSYTVPAQYASDDLFVRYLAAEDKLRRVSSEMDDIAALMTPSPQQNDTAE